MPKSFVFPARTSLWNAWRKWWLGSVAIVGDKQYQLKPYRYLKDRDILKQNVKNALKNCWRPILTKMMETPDLNVAANFIPTITKLEESYCKSMDHLRTRFSFLFVPLNEERLKVWTKRTWSKRTQWCHVLKNGTVHDKARLPEQTKHNQRHKEKRSFSVIQAKPRKSKRRHQSS